MHIVERISLIVVQIKTPKHEEIISKIYWNQANLTGEEAGKPMRLCTQHQHVW